jgi:hypothetical protein
MAAALLGIWTAMAGQTCRLSTADRLQLAMVVSIVDEHGLISLTMPRDYSTVTARWWNDESERFELAYADKSPDPLMLGKGDTVFTAGFAIRKDRLRGWISVGPADQNQRLELSCETAKEYFHRFMDELSELKEYYKLREKR